MLLEDTLPTGCGTDSNQFINQTGTMSQQPDKVIYSMVGVSKFYDKKAVLKDIYLGVPVVLGTNGIEKIIELDLNEGEKALLHTSAKHVKEVMDVLDNMKAPA